MKKSLIAILFLLYLSPAFAILNTPTLIAPAIGSLNNDPNVLLDWSAIAGATGYEYKLSTNASLAGASILTVTGTSQVSTSNLLFGTVYYWQVRAIKTSFPIDSSSWSATWSFTTIDQLALVSPTNSSLNIEPNVLLDWTGIFGITNYDYQWDTVATFNSPLSYYASVGATSQVNSANLRFGTKYFWRVRARHSADTTQWSAIWNFTTIDHLTHISPTNNSTDISLSPLIDWTGIFGITGYQYRYSTSINFSNPILFTIGATSQANLSSLSYGTQYFWQVRTFHAADTSEWSLPWSFTTVYQLTIAPSLISPANSTMNIPVAGTSLQWSSVSSATLYEYQFDDNSLFTSPVANTVSVIIDSTGSLLPNTTYYWKVRAGNGSGYSPWSLIWSFTTESITGIAENELQTNISIYPNPSNGRFHFIIDGSQFAENCNVEIYNMQGKKIYQSAITNLKSDIDLSNQANGFYFVKIYNGQTTCTKKMIIQ